MPTGSLPHQTELSGPGRCDEQMNEQLSSQSRAKQHFIQLTLDTAAHGGRLHSPSSHHHSVAYQPPCYLIFFFPFPSLPHSESCPLKAFLSVLSFCMSAPHPVIFFTLLSVLRELLEDNLHPHLFMATFDKCWLNEVYDECGSPSSFI